VRGKIKPEKKTSSVSIGEKKKRDGGKEQKKGSFVNIETRARVQLRGRRVDEQNPVPGKEARKRRVKNHLRVS